MAAPTVVQSTTATTGDVSSAVATPALTGIAGGNLLVLIVAGWESGNNGFPNTITDTQGRSLGAGWNLIPSSQGPSNGFTLQAYWATSIAGSCTVSVGMATGVTGNAACCLMEVSGADRSSPIDQVLLATATSTGPSVGPTGATSQADELAIAAFTCADTNSGWSNPPTSYTSQAQITSKVYLNVSTQGLSSTGTQTVSYGTLASSTQWTALIVTLKAYIAPTTDDLVAVTSTTTGTGTYTLGSAVSGFQGTTGLTNGTVYGYAADDGAGGYEVGTGTYTSAGTTLSRGAIICSSNSNNAVSWAAGTRTIKITALAQQLRPTLTIFTAGGTWTPKATSKFFIAQVYGAGGSGGGGAGANTVAGGGGGGGGYQLIRGRIADISTPVTITIGSGPSGGAGSAGAVGTNGTAGGASSFGSYANAYGGGGGGGGDSSGGGGGGGAGYAGAGGNGSGSTGGAAGSGGGVAGPNGSGTAGNRATTFFGGGSGAAGSSSTAGVSGGMSFNGGQGGAGGGGPSAGTGRAGGNSPATPWGASQVNGGAAGPTAGGNGTSTNYAGGQGGAGGGGGGNGPDNGGNGGNGGSPGGGGGGGGGGSSTGTGGTGGAGARGEVRVWEF